MITLSNCNLLLKRVGVKFQLGCMIILHQSIGTSLKKLPMTTDTWAEDSDDEHIPTTGAVNTQLTELRAYVDTQDTADIDAEIAACLLRGVAEINNAEVATKAVRLDSQIVTKTSKPPALLLIDDDKHIYHICCCC